MSKAADIVNAVFSVADQNTQKLKVRKLEELSSPELTLYLRYAIDPSFAYHMTKKNIPAPAAHSTSKFEATTIGMLALLKGMHEQSLPLPETRLYVADWLKRADESLRLLFTWAIDRKLPGKLGRSIINKAFPGLIYKQPYGGVAPWDPDAAVRRFRWGSRPQHIQRKEDGMTLLIDLANRTVRTRQGQDVTKQMSRYMKVPFESMGGTPKVFHIEAMMYQPDRATLMPRPAANGLYNKIFKHAGSVDPARMVFIVLDCIDALGFYDGLDNSPQAKRYAVAKMLVEQYQRDLIDAYIAGTCPKIMLVKQHPVMWLDDAREICQKWIRYGREGAIIKDPYGRWTATKMTSQMKMKNEFETTLMVVGYKPHKEHPEWVGSLICTSAEGKIESAVGSGLNEEPGHPLDRTQGFAAFDGKFVEVKAESISKHNALNLPRILEVRTDKQFADTYDEVEAAERTSRGWKE